MNQVNTFKWSHLLGKTSLFLTMLTLSIALTILFVPLFEWSLYIGNIPEQVGMRHETIMENYYVLLRYLHAPWINELHMPDFPTSASGAFHFYEVKILFGINYAVLFLSGICSIYYVKYLKKQQYLWSLKQPFKVAIAVPIALTIFLAFSFDYMFVLFHQILFNNEDWLFNPATDPIITVLTQDFFMYCFLFAFILLESMLVGGYLIGKTSQTA
ncbi:TIGR01906 family membrane protein [Dolosigranulum savutiense]|uniref:TIGR01906 family membrane protein n=1 Tax=Dolosigranulum savutiense TaxID=3110288 RepID=A0AB74TS92_9LACT